MMLFLDLSRAVAYRSKIDDVTHPHCDIGRWRGVRYRVERVPRLVRRVWRCWPSRRESKERRLDVQRDIAANRQERKERQSAAQRLQFQRSLFMLRAAHGRRSRNADDAAAAAIVDDDDDGDDDTLCQERLQQQEEQDKTIQDFALFIYRLESDFEDKRRRLEKMLSGASVRIAPNRTTPA